MVKWMSLGEDVVKRMSLGGGCGEEDVIRG